MKQGIHPEYHHDAVVKCACGNTFTTGSVKEELTNSTRSSVLTNKIRLEFMRKNFIFFLIFSFLKQFIIYYKINKRGYYNTCI